MVDTIKWIGDVDGHLELIDQRKLPAELVKLQCTEISQVYEAIKTLAVRGAPALGVAAGYGLVLAMQSINSGTETKKLMKELTGFCRYLSSSRPTAVNLFWALERIKQRTEEFITVGPNSNLHSLKKFVFLQANAICQEDARMCAQIGKNGEKFICDGAGILTHCNAGTLATAGQGTALSLMYEAHNNGKKFKVYADETRPLLQGARLTAWELAQAGIDVTVICDNMAGWLMKQGRIDAVITGADRIAANGDTANKIGTYSLSVLAKEHNIPFYIAAPSSTFDLSIESGRQIPIEQRASDEISFMGSRKITPDGVDIYNPAFDVTPERNILAIITEIGVIEKPDKNKISKHLML